MFRLSVLLLNSMSKLIHNRCTYVSLLLKLYGYIPVYKRTIASLFYVLRYQPGLKKGEFSKFLISGRLDKVFQELSFKKKFHKKNIISVQSYWTLKFTTR